MAARWYRFRRLRQRTRRQAPFTEGAARFLLVAVVATALSLVVGTGTLFAAAVGVYTYYARDLPAPETVETRATPSSTLIYDRNGRLLYEIFDPRYGRRQYIPLAEISPYLVQATIATEDHDFYLNSGINLRGVTRAFVSILFNLDDPEDFQGGSSITQQLVKNVLIPEDERTQKLVSRKIKEAILAHALTQRYSKNQILEWYLNEVFYGNLSYGIEAAAQAYFGKSARDLTLAEAAMLAGLPQAPAFHSPLVDPARAKRRQQDVLNLMVRQGYITSAEAEAAAQVELQYQPSRITIEAPHFVMYVRDLLEQRYGRYALYRKGLRVTTTLDLDLQNYAQDLVRNYIAANGRRFNANNASLVAIDPKTGEILVMVGSADYFSADIQGQVNMATAERQPGSTFKPITYLTSFLKGWGPATVVEDTPLTYVDDLGRVWEPQNVDKTFRGRVAIRTALANSMNIPAVRAILFVGVDNVLDMAHQMGITTLTRKNWYGPALTLGGGEVKLLDLVYAYTVLANNGTMRGQFVAPEARKPGFRELEPTAILKVEDMEGNVLKEYAPVDREVVPAPYAYLITSILSDNEARALLFGRNNPLFLRDRPAAAKTGTTEDNRDNWTIGYTPDVVAGVWVGNTDNTEMFRSALSFATAATLWHDFMVKFHEGKPVTPFERPPGLVEVDVCAGSGLPAGPACPNKRQEIFVQGQVPKIRDNGGTRFVLFDRTTGQPATPNTPPEHIEERLITAVPIEVSDRYPGQDLPPQSELAPALRDRVRIASPESGSTVTGLLTITGSANSDRFTGYVLEYGPGTNPTTWTTIVAAKQPVDDGVLGTLDTSKLSGGVATLRLTVLDQEYSPQVFRVIVTVDAPPTTGAAPAAGTPSATTTPTAGATPAPSPTPPGPAARPQSPAPANG
ncbi:MAG: transglycosylase domain-containing protein [Chloroflexi bacterium]|nr:transglycosylase domain-containing protein [Chloroflexota bacterium]